MDTAATTPLLSEVQAAIVDGFSIYGNPSSLHHKGVEAEHLVDEARAKVAKCLGARQGKVIFTGCGTEANNLAIMGAAKRLRNRGQHIVTTQIEHPSVLETVKRLEHLGWQVSYVAPRANGSIVAEDILRAVRQDTVLVTMMHVNNETGAVLPVEEVGQALRKLPRVLFHVDGIQAFGKIFESGRVSGADLYSFSGHKIGAPKGVGGLFVRNGVELEPVLYGGGQEFGYRSGTENLLGIHALGVAAEYAYNNAQENWNKVEQLMQRLQGGLVRIAGCHVERPSAASPYILNVAFPGLKAEVLVHALESQQIYVSTGSACSNIGGHATGSHVLKAMAKSPEEISGSIRLSLGAWQTSGQIDYVLDVLAAKIAWLHEIVRG